jgi:hypothetical protein
MRQQGSVLVLAFVVACASPGRQRPAPAAPQPTPQQAPADSAAVPAAPHEANRQQDCVVMQSMTEQDGLREERAWQSEHYPGSRKVGQSLSAPDSAGRIYDFIDILTAASEKTTLCFDITNFFGKM